MKKLNYFLIAMLAVFAFSCDNENDPPPTSGAPTITAPSVATTVEVGKVITMTFGVNAPGKVAEVTVATTSGTAVIAATTSIIGETSGNVDVTFTAPLTEGSETVTLTVKDAQSTPKTTDGTAPVTVTLGPTSASELLVTSFAAAPIMDGEIDDIWNTAQKLVNTTTVPTLANRNTWLNSDGQGVEEDLGLFFPYSGESNDFTMRSGVFGSDIFFLIEWDDAEDSKDRQSWYFDGTWKGEHKYANAADDKYYEDKFAFLFPITDVAGFSTTGDCYVTCHQGLTLAKDMDKHSRHYLNGVDEKIDMWHWKRVRGTYADQVDDQMMTYDDPAENSGANGRHGDSTGDAGYSGNSVKLLITGGVVGVDSVNVPKYIIPNETDYYWIDADQIADGTAKLITAVDANGVLTYAGGTIDPAEGGYEQGTGTKRIPSVTTKAFTLGRADINVKAMHTGTGWVCEVQRKLNTSDADDIVFVPQTDVFFGFAIFNNAAIAHSIKTNLKLTWE